jgi:hypothetical protein
MNNKPINEYDMTKKMLGLIRESSINEASSDTYELTGKDLEDAKEKFKDDLAKGVVVEFGPFYVMTDTTNAEWSGVFKDNGMEWTFSLTEENGVYITANTIKLTEGVVERIRLLRAHYDIWKDEWSENLTKESYKNAID